MGVKYRVPCKKAKQQYIYIYLFSCCFCFYVELFFASDNTKKQVKLSRHTHKLRPFLLGSQKYTKTRPGTAFQKTALHYITLHVHYLFRLLRTTDLRTPLAETARRTTARPRLSKHKDTTSLTKLFFTDFDLNPHLCLGDTWSQGFISSLPW